ncbi:MAG: Ca-activated chloride channel, partial [Thermoleophilaceae bacterium]|nr:Ca-activated chloride channel [Thermoleophilaceae bacterium]
LPLLAAGYWRWQQRRRAAAAAFAAPPLQPNVAPERPGWRRHAPMLAFLLAIAILVLAAARPQRTVAVTVDSAAVMLATDVSGSMTATDVKPSRLVAAREAALRFVRQVPSGVSVGVLAFNATPSVLQSPTRDRDAVVAAIGSMTPSGGTATGDAIAAATRALRVPGRTAGKRPPAAIVVLSDGKSARGIDPVAAARAARRAGIPVYTVALGTAGGTIQVPRHGGGTQTQRVPPDPATLAAVARASGGRSFTADTASGLSQVYRDLGSQLSHKHEKRQVTSAFAGGGLVLLLAGAAMSLRWFGRLI